MVLSGLLHYILAMRYALLAAVLFAVVGHFLSAEGHAQSQPVPLTDPEILNRLVPIQDAETERIKEERERYAEDCIMDELHKMQNRTAVGTLRRICRSRAGRKYPLPSKVK